MKTKIIVFIFFSFLIKTTVSQEYIPLPDSNAVWHVIEGSCCPEDYNDIYYYIRKDTIINNTGYKIISTQYNYNKSHDIAFRQDSLKKIWVIYLGLQYSYSTGCGNPNANNNDSTEYLLYDFNLNINDSVDIFYPYCSGAFSCPDNKYYKLKVINIDTINVCGIARKRLYLYGENDNDSISCGFLMSPYEWVEGIGTTVGPVYPFTTPHFETGFWLQSIEINNDLCIIANDEIIELSGNEVSIFPNPVVSESTIGLSSSILKNKITIKIIDITGKEIKKIVPDKNHIKIYSSDYSSGLYLIKIQTNEKAITKRIIIQ